MNFPIMLAQLPQNPFQDNGARNKKSNLSQKYKLVLHLAIKALSLAICLTIIPAIMMQFHVAWQKTAQQQLRKHV